MGAGGKEGEGGWGRRVQNAGGVKEMGEGRVDKWEHEYN